MAKNMKMGGMKGGKGPGKKITGFGAKMKNGMGKHNKMEGPGCMAK